MPFGVPARPTCLSGRPHATRFPRPTDSLGD
jgi:hypothetical protein